MGATTESNNTSLDTSNNYSSVKEFNPATNEMMHLKPFDHRDQDGSATSRVEIEEELKDQSHLKANSLRTQKLFVIPDNEDGDSKIL